MVGRRMVGCWTATLLALAWCVGPATAQPNRSDAFELVPLVAFGGYDERPAYAFSRVVAGAVLSPREVAVVDRLAREIRVFSEQGTHLRTFGREGQGPGEFQFLRAIHPFSQERLAAWDFQAKRLSVFGVDGRHYSTTTISMEPMARMWADYVGSFSDGSFVLRNEPNEMALMNEPAGYRLDPTSFVRYSQAGDELGVLCVVPGPSRRLFHEDGTWGLEERLLERSVVGVVAGDVLYCGSTESLFLERVSPSGDVLSPFAVGVDPVPVTAGEVERIREMEEERILGAQERRSRSSSSVPFALPDNTAARLERLSRKEAYETRPAFRSLFADSAGGIWIEEYGPPDTDVARWVRWNGGTRSGWLEVPSTETVMDIDHGLLLTRSEDELGVFLVHLRRIVDPDA